MAASDRSASARKRLAVPFRAADTPAERSEFAQPDVAIILTVLAYYYDGLSEQEFADAVEQLLRNGLNQQRRFYQTWLELSWPNILQGKPLATSALFVAVRPGVVACSCKLSFCVAHWQSYNLIHILNTLVLLPLQSTEMTWMTSARSIPAMSSK